MPPSDERTGMWRARSRRYARILIGANRPVAALANDCYAHFAETSDSGRLVRIPGVRKGSGMPVGNSEPDLSWMADAPVFIDGQTIGTFYDAVVGREFRAVDIPIRRGASRPHSAFWGHHNGGGASAVMEEVIVAGDRLWRRPQLSLNVLAVHEN
jgi:hypothetical protein